MDTSFSYRIRVAACDRCGAPSEAAVTGGNFTCRFCNAVNRIDVRDEALVSPARAPIPEHERIARLRMQDNRPLLPPPSIQHLVEGGRIPAWKVEEAVAVWNASRQELRASRGNYDAAERLVFLTMVLAQHFELEGDKMRQRSMLEGALDVVSLPRHRQILRGFLCRAAVRSGDLEAAEAWLQPCDPRSDDIQMDSAWRFSRAFIDTAKGNFQRVLEVLGPGPHDVPIADAFDDVCAVFRANAWEKLGRTDQAVALLRERLPRAGGAGRQTIQRIIETYADWHLCTASYPQAAAAHAAVAGQMAGERATGGLHVAFIPLGIMMLVIGLVLVLVATGGAMDEIDVRSFATFGSTGGTFTILGLVFVIVGLVSWRSAKRAAWLRIHGISATAQVQAVSRTGTRINGVPMMRFTLLVHLPGRAPYTARASALVSGPHGVRPGATVPVRVHPNKPSEVILELE